MDVTIASKVLIAVLYYDCT